MVKEPFADPGGDDRGEVGPEPVVDEAGVVAVHGRVVPEQLIVDAGVGDDQSCMLMPCKAMTL